MSESAVRTNIIEKKDRNDLLAPYHLRDLSEDEGLNSLVKLASKLCDVPISMVNIIDEHTQYTKASYGWELGTELPREYAFCDHTIRESKWMIVPDLAADERFSHSQIVEGEPHVRFYAGTNIKDPGGENLGTLCLMDHRPKELSKDQLESLEMLGKEVESRLHLRRQHFHIQRQNEELRSKSRFLEHSADIMFIVDPGVYQIRYMDTKGMKLLGYDEDELRDAPLSMLRPGNGFFEALNAWSAGDRGKSFQCDATLCDSDQEMHWYHISLDEYEGLWYITARSIEEQKKAEFELSKTLKLLKKAQRLAKMGYWEWYPQTNELFWSKETREICAVDESVQPSLELMIERTVEEDRDHLRKTISRVIGGGEADVIEHRIRMPDGNHKNLRQTGEIERNDQGHAVKVTGTIQDVTQQKANERKILRSLKEKEVLLAELHHRVKNNLAVISGILQLELFNEEAGQSKPAKQILNSMISKIRSMSVVHEHLYQNEQFSRVPLGEQFKQIISLAAKNHRGSKDIKTSIQSDDIRLNINQAIPFSLVVEELLERVYFRNEEAEVKSSEMYISLSIAEDQVCLKIRTNEDIFQPGVISEEDALLFALLEQISGELICECGKEVTVVFTKNDSRGSSDSGRY